MSKQTKQLVVSGEDVESEEDEQLEREGELPTELETKGSENNKSSSHSVKVVTFGEAPESDNEDFGSTISLASSANSLGEAGLLRLDSEAAAVLAPILPQRQMSRLNFAIVKKHRERNKSLRTNITDKFLTPAIMQSAKKIEKLSQNLSNSQMQMQEALFQSRISTGNLLKLQKELENFLEIDYLKELKIQPTDEDCQDQDVIETEFEMENEDEMEDGSVQDLENHQNQYKASHLSSGSLLAASFTGGVI